VAAILFGASAPAASTLAGDVNAFTLAGLLYVGAALAVLPATLLNPPRRRPLRRATPRLAGAVLTGGAIAPVLLAAGLARTPAATASLLLNLELVATVALAALVFHEHIGRPVALGTSLVVGAGCILTWSAAPQFRGGAILIVGACLCWAIDNCLTAGLDQLASHHITLAKGAVAGSANFALGLALAGWPTGGQVVAALVIGLFGYGLSITLWIAGARELGAARGQLIFAIAPFVGAIIAWTALGEPVLASQLVALVPALVGVSTVLRSAHVHEHRHTTQEHDHEHAHDDLHHGHRHTTDVERHAHSHSHRELIHAHPHVPDLHHRHEHS
jgi:drug/metabolite transporter (DMT)-like permease